MMFSIYVVKVIPDLLVCPGLRVRLKNLLFFFLFSSLFSNISIEFLSLVYGSNKQR